MPRVLLTGFCAVPGPRRAGVQLRQVIRSLTSLHSVDLLVVREGEQAYVERQGSVRVLRVPTHEADLRSQIQAFQRALKRQLDGADYDVVHCRDSWSAVPVLDARSRLGYAVVYDLTRSPLGETTFDSELDAQYARDEDACLLAADMVLAPTPAAVKALQQRGKPERVVLSPPGVDVDRFDWEHVDKSAVPKILYAGSIDPGRGVRVLVRAMAAIVREVDARLVLAGSMAPKFDQALRDGIRELNLADKIEVLSPVDHDQMPALIASATVCVVPAAADLTPNPTVVYPTKILEYMACRRPIVAPRRETVAQVVENNREALLFEPGDPVDLARKVLRLLGEPLLRDRLAQNAYERVRRDFTASAARRALRAAYTVLSERFELAAHDPDDDVPKSEVIADDDFEATVFEEAPAPPPVDTALNKLEALDDSSIEMLEVEIEEDGAGGTSSAQVIVPPSSAEPDETAERAPVPPPRRNDSDAWTVSAIAAPPAPPGRGDWRNQSVGAGGRGLDDGGPDADDGTPIEGVAVVPPALPVTGVFVAGEIDVPAPPPERGRDSSSVDLRGAGNLMGTDADPDTGSRTPPIERR
ncbi:MAG TPA: glycosyltransferase family 4 protein [Kofleriaceae bacterium]|nr:glycosyltransferase family 4 protein [Kofleriaceae bacterium]